MIQRNLQEKIEFSLKTSPVVGILGPRQVGKTTLSKEIQKKYTNSVYLDLELPSDFNKLIDAEYFLKSYEDKLIVVDEIQHRPELFTIIRALVDQNRKPARFLILGSSSPDLLRKSSETLAGRIIYHQLTPFLLDELGKSHSNMDNLWLRGGFPESFLAENNELSFRWREAFISAFLERDIPKLGINIPSIRLRRFWTMLAHLHGSLWNASKIAASLGVTPPTSKYYIDILNDTFIVRQLLPYFPNLKKRIVKSPKIYIKDTGLLHTLLGLKTKEELLGHPVAGHSWEGFALEQIINTIHESYGKYFYRTGAGAEIDLIITKADNPLVCIEIKFSLSPKLTQGFWNGMEDLNCKKGFLVYPGTDVFPVRENVIAVPITLIDDYLSKIL